MLWAFRCACCCGLTVKVIADCEACLTVEPSCYTWPETIGTAHPLCSCSPIRVGQSWCAGHHVIMNPC
jgi:hypothetical protein